MTTHPTLRRLLYRSSANQTNVVLLLLGLALLFLSHHLAVEFDHFVIGYSETSVCALAVYLAAAIMVWTQPVDRRTFWIIAATALLCRLALLTPEPNLSSDIYRYVWDGYVQHHGVNPYRYFPGNEHLRFLREDDIFPYINRRDYAPTIYPPVAQMLYWVATWFSPTLTLMKLTMYAMEGVTVFALARMLEAMGRRREEVIVYAWSPLCIWEFGSSGHVDAAVIATVCLALLFRLRNRPWLTGFALGAAVMIKFYPLLLFPALWRRRDWRMPAALTAVVLGGYAVYCSVGMKVFGFAGGYASEEGMNSGSRYFLLDAARRLPGLGNLGIPAFLVLCVLVFAPLLVWCWRANRRPGFAFLPPAAALAFALMLLFSPHYPWYVAWLVPFLVLMPELPGFVYTYSVFYWLTTRFAEPGPKMFFANTWVYGATAVAFALWLAWRTWGRALNLRWPWQPERERAAA